MKFFDSHCHLDLLAQKVDLASAFKLAAENQVERFLVPATTASSWQSIRQIKQKHSSQVDIALGLHPYFIQQHQNSHLELLEIALKSQPDIVAVGEIGLDFSVQCAPTQAIKTRQIQVFKQQLALAQKYQLPVILHHRQSIDQLCKYIRQSQFKYGGVVHAFSGSLQQAQNMIELGFKLGIGGTITYLRAQKTRSALEKIPSEYLLLESDAPDMPVSGRQGQVNQPAYIAETFRHLRILKSQSETGLAEQLWRNTLQTFPKLNRINP